MKKLIFTIIFGSLLSFSYAAQVDTLLVYSSAMKKEIKTVVITPDSYNSGGEYPVFYLLHGYSGDHSSWVKGMPATVALADTYQMIIVAPNGDYSSWYFDSPVDPTMRYETFIAKELVTWTDQNYRTVKKREGRAISGLSMGGHGAMFLGFRHQDVYGACGSMSGGVDIRPFPANWDLPKRLGKMSENPQTWESHTVIKMLHLLAPGSLDIIFDCGTEDFFYENNVKLHEELLYRNIPHEFISRPGKHDAAYWNNAVQYQALFFSKFFDKNR